MSNRVNRRVEELRRNIFEVSVRLFADQGIDATTVDEICAKADVPRRTLSYHFPTKSDLVRAIGQAAESHVIGQIQEGKERCGDATARVEFVFEVARTMMRRMGPMRPDVLASTIHAFHDSSKKQARRESARLWDAVRDLLSGDGGEGADLPSHLDAGTLTTLVMGSLYAVLLDMAGRETSDLDTELSKVSMAIVLMLRAESR